MACVSLTSETQGASRVKRSRLMQAWCLVFFVVIRCFCYVYHTIYNVVRYQFCDKKLAVERLVV